MIKVVREHGAEGLKGARLVSVDTITDKLVCAFLWDAWHVDSAFAETDLEVGILFEGAD